MALPDAGGKGETREHFTQAKAAGFLYLQGYFFCKPEVMHAKEIPAIALTRCACCRQFPNRTWSRELESLMKGEASVCYRLLQYMNSAAIGVRNEVPSI